MLGVAGLQRAVQEVVTPCRDEREAQKKRSQMFSQCSRNSRDTFLCGNEGVVLVLLFLAGLCLGGHWSVRQALLGVRPPLQEAGCLLLLLEN